MASGLETVNMLQVLRQVCSSQFSSSTRECSSSCPIFFKSIWYIIGLFIVLPWRETVLYNVYIECMMPIHTVGIVIIVCLISDFIQAHHCTMWTVLKHLITYVRVLSSLPWARIAILATELMQRPSLWASVENVTISIAIVQERSFDPSTQFHCMILHPYNKLCLCYTLMCLMYSESSNWVRWSRYL